MLVKVSCSAKGGGKEGIYFRLVPIVLEVCEKSELYEINLPDIDLNACIHRQDKMILIDESESYRIVDRKDLPTSFLQKEPVKVEFNCP